MKRNLKTGSFFLLMMKPIFLKVFLIKVFKFIFSRKPVINRIICSLTDHTAADTVKQFPASKAI